MTTLEFPMAWLPLADAILKASLVLLAAAVATRLLRRASAAMRHLIWTIALVSALLMPVLSLALPRWQLPLLSTPAAQPPAVIVTPSAPQPSRARESDDVSAPALSTRSAITNTPASEDVWNPIASIGFELVVVLIWAIGAALIVSRVLIGVLAVQWMSRRGQRVLDAPWMKMAVQLAFELGVSPNITFLRNRRADAGRGGRVAGGSAADRASPRIGSREAPRLPHASRRPACLRLSLVQSAFVDRRPPGSRRT
jgi:hypothetical protein